MNIRIGNDVRVELPLNLLGDIDPANIRFARCIFIANKQEAENSNCHMFNCSQQHTIHNCNDLSYNVLPHNCCKGHCHADPHDCGFVVNKLFNHIAMCQVEGESVVAYFPGEFLRCLGDYDCKFELKVFQQGWDFDNTRMYTLYEEDAFTLDNKSDVWANGPVYIKPQGSKNDTFVLSTTEDELRACKGDYSSLMRTELGFDMPKDKEKKCTVSVVGTGNKIVVFSKYDNLSLRFGDFIVNFNVYSTSTGYYMYVTQASYSNQSMTWYLTLASSSNDIIPDNPYEVPNENQLPEQPTPPEDDPSDDIHINYLDGNTIVFYGKYENEQLNNFGQIGEWNTIVL